MKIKVSEAAPIQLDWMVNSAEGMDSEIIQYGGRPALRFEYKLFSPTTDWSQGGPIIERECIQLLPNLTKDKKFPDWNWSAASPANGSNVQIYGPTPLIAAMRCYVASKMGDEVEIPEELNE